MEELGIYEDTSIGTGIGSEDEDSESEDEQGKDGAASHLGDDFQLFRAKATQGRHSRRMNSASNRGTIKGGTVDASAALQRSPGSALQRRDLSSPTKYLASRSSSAAGRRTSLSSYRRPSSLMAREDSTSSRRSSIFELRPTPTGIYASTAPLPVESHAHGSERRPSAATQRHVEALRQTPVSATLERRSARSAGNWERHLKNVPFKLDKKVYLTLPYHDLSVVSGPDSVMSQPPPEEPGL
jgi:hypothetical protein